MNDSFRHFVTPFFLSHRVLYNTYVGEYIMIDYDTYYCCRLLRFEKETLFFTSIVYDADTVNEKLTSIIDFKTDKSIMNMKIICCCFLLKNKSSKTF